MSYLVNCSTSTLNTYSMAGVGQQEVYIRDYRNMGDAVSGLGRYFDFYNHGRLHQTPVSRLLARGTIIVMTPTRSHRPGLIRSFYLGYLLP